VKDGRTDRYKNVRVVALGVSGNKYWGKGSVDIGSRLSNTTELE